MARLARKRRRRMPSFRGLLYIFIEKAKTSQEPATGRKISKKRSTKRKTTSRVQRKKHQETAKYQKKTRSKRRASSPPRGVRRRQRRRQRKRMSFSTMKQPLPAFFLFMAQHRPQLQESNPHWTVVKTVKKLGTLWHKQPEKDKTMYKEQAAWLRRRKQKKKAQVRA